MLFILSVKIEKQIVAFKETIVSPGMLFKDESFQ